MSKLDSAFDIDPLFHKMSKTFDEGGAKGLLLVNLGVGASGCNIVFDSKEEAASIAQDGSGEEKEDTVTISSRQEGMIDISSLTTKLDTILGGESLESIPLVPQLRSLRQEYEQLEAEGFVDHNIPKTKVRDVACNIVVDVSDTHTYCVPVFSIVTPLRHFPRGGEGSRNVDSPRSIGTQSRFSRYTCPARHVRRW